MENYVILLLAIKSLTEETMEQEPQEVSQLREALAELFPKAAISVEGQESPDGAMFIEIIKDSNRVSVEHRPGSTIKFAKSLVLNTNSDSVEEDHSLKYSVSDTIDIVLFLLSPDFQPQPQ